MLRFDAGLLRRVDIAAKRRGISRSAWIAFKVSEALDAERGPDETALGREAASPQAGNQLDLFSALPGDLPTHDQQEMMERPFFSLSKSKRIEPIDYRVRNGTTEIQVRVTANAETGMATIWTRTS